MTLIARVIHWGRRTTGGIVSILIAGISAILLILASNIVARIGTAIIASVAIGIIIGSRLVAQDISLTCIQDEPEPRSAARSQHYNEYDLEDGYIELEVYIDIPDWKHEFEIELDVAEPFKLSAWNLPDSVHFNNDENMIFSRQKIHGFTFTLQAGGEPEELGIGDHTFTFIDHDSKNEVDTIQLETGSTKE
jgi:hypothetical protein